jgi:DNA-binding LytR/AlgR family response regulator
VNIIICDDSAESLDALDSAVRACPRFNRGEINIVRIVGGQEFLDAIRRGIDIDFIFIDVRMPDVGGIDAVAALPEDCDAPIVFVTGYTENWPETRTFYESGYLVKPYSQETFNKTVGVIIDHRGEAYYFAYSERDELNSRETTYKDDVIHCNLILYFTAHGHIVEMHTNSGAKVLYGKAFKEIVRELEPHGFFLCHRSFLINLRHYRDRTQRDVILKTRGGQVYVNLSRDKIAALDDAVIDYKTRGKYAF